MKAKISKHILSVLIGTACFMLVAACDKNDIGKCVEEDKICNDCACPEIYDPVCGCDGVTYSNSCFAEIAGVTTFTKGECNSGN